MFQVRRYDPRGPIHGRPILTEQLWQRGIKSSALKAYARPKEVGRSTSAATVVRASRGTLGGVSHDVRT